MDSGCYKELLLSLCLRVLCGVIKSREQDKVENSHLEGMDWKKRTSHNSSYWIENAVLNNNLQYKSL